MPVAAPVEVARGGACELGEAFAACAGDDACIDAGIEPPSLKVPSEMLGQAAMDPMYWLSGDNDWAFHRLRTDLLDERDTIGLIQIVVTPSSVMRSPSSCSVAGLAAAMVEADGTTDPTISSS